jgi:hypothetical protein
MRMPSCTFPTLSGASILVGLLLSTSVSAEPPRQAEAASPGAEATVEQGDFRRRSYRKHSLPGFAKRRGVAGPPLSAAAASDAPGGASCEPVAADRIYRLIEGIDNCVLPMTAAEISTELQDPFATSVLRKDSFPDTVDAILQALSTSGLIETSYIIGEGGQVPLSVAPRDAARNLRYVVTWGPSESSAQILLSAAAGGHSGFHQVISWDSASSKYNFYQLIPQVGEDGPFVWSWAGDSTMARQPQTLGKGCFDCHHNGVIIMKELQAPWNNWDSQLATIASAVVPEAVASEALFQDKTGAQVLERAVQGGFQTYYRAWLRERFHSAASDIQLTDVPQMLRHITTNTTLNFQSSQMQSRGANTSPPNQDISGLPRDFLVWDSVLSTVLALDYTRPDVTLPRDAYDQFLKDHAFELVQRFGDQTLYAEQGSTYFATFVPVPPAEDVFFITQLRSAGIVTDKLIAAILLVDFTNPVFSRARARLQAYAEMVPTGTVTDGVSSVPTDFAEKVRQGAQGQPPCDQSRIDECTAEQQFLSIWDLSDADWKARAEARISAYIDAINALQPQQQVEQLMSRVVLRQQQFTTWPLLSNLHELSLQVPQTSLKPAAAESNP